MKNRFAVAAIIAAMVVGLCSLSIGRAQKHAPVLPSVQASIGGNATLAPAPNAYLAIALPANYKSDPLSQKLLADTAKPNFARMRSIATTKIYVEGDADFEHRFRAPVGQLPAVCAQDSDGKTYKWSGANVKNAESQLDNCIKKLLNKVHPEEPKPKDEPRPEPQPGPTLPDVNPQQPANEEPVNGLAVALCCGAVGLCVWGVMFRNRPS